MRIVVTGQEGQIVRSLIERAQGGAAQIIAVGRPELDLAAPEGIAKAIAAACPDVVISAAAYTAVDRAEAEPDLARRINVEGARAVAAAASSLSVPVIHLSTDYVFDGGKDGPWREDDATGPLGVYGRTKLAGEQAVAEAAPDHVIIRTAWVYGPFGTNFVKTMLRLAQDRGEVRVVADQIGNPSCSLDIADGLLRIASRLVESDRPELRGIFHMAGAGETSWADFAEAIFQHSSTCGGPSATVARIATTEFPTPATRPANSRLDCGKLNQAYGIALPPWRGVLPEVVARLVADLRKD